jgi:hypothetical protein
MTQQQYINLQKRIMLRVEKKFYSAAYAAVKSQIDSFSNTLKDTGIASALTRLDLMFMNGAMIKMVKALYVSAALPIAKRHYQELKSIVDKLPKPDAKQFDPVIETKAAFGFNEKWTREIIAFFNQYLLDQATLYYSGPIKDFIRGILDQAIEEGWGVDKIANELDTQGDVFSKWKAKQIVRTEAVRATNYASMLSASEFDYEMEKTWLEVIDKRTRKTHRHLSGVGHQTVDFMSKYSNGLMFPGDPNGAAKEVINCRCTQKVTPKRDEKGMLIPIHHKLPLNVALGLAA